ncbi:solute carrier family 2, facilitated glucose transporter member 1-like isoform X2 [Tachypleus tridentatus]|uniref:solute carrier family 2, facilitated glucose transporter member 1-like isoform X2 n=1 Tax=Tachypleus tridentatus TaxID=6853 RepID=UPI003FD40DE0
MAACDKHAVFMISVDISPNEDNLKLVEPCPEVPNLKHQRITRKLLMVAIVGFLGNSLPAGYNIGVLNTPEEVLREFVHRSVSQRDLMLSKSHLNILWSCVVSVFLVGAIIGSCCAGWTANKIGRRPTLLLNSAIGLVSAAVFAVARVACSVEMIILGRLLVGVFSGIGSSVGPLYMMETGPSHLRGALGVLQQLGLCVGILIAQILGQKDILGNTTNWPILLSAYSCFIAIGLLTLLFCPESPAYLYIRMGEYNKAFKELEKLRGYSATLLHSDVLLLRTERKMNESCSWTIMKVLKDPLVRKSLFAVCIMHLGQQLCGINAVPLVNSCQRRNLILVSICSVACSLVLLTISMALQSLSPALSYVIIIFSLCFVLGYGIGLGPLPFMIGSELFQQGPRATGMGLGCLANWLANFIVALTFPLLQQLLDQYVFLIFATFTVFLGIYLYKYLPETKNINPVDLSSFFYSSVSEDQV